VASFVAFYFIVTYQPDQVLGDMMLIWFVIPLALAALFISGSAAYTVARLSILLNGPRNAIPVGLMALVPGIGLAIALVLARAIPELLIQNGLRVEICHVCNQSFVAPSPGTGVCPRCLRAIS